MFKALFKLVVVSFLTFINLALFFWCVNQLGLDEIPLKKTLISSVQAKITPPEFLRRHLGGMIQQPAVISPATVQIVRPLALRFQLTQLHIAKSERMKLEDILQHLQKHSSWSAKILFGVARSAINIPSPHLAKLRAQAVARIIYPYTPKVKMYYRPTMKEGLVIVEFFDLP